MKISLLLFAMSLCFSFSALAKDETKKCPLNVSQPRAPTVVITPESGLSTDEVQVEFHVPAEYKGLKDNVKYLKIEDIDGSISLLMNVYLSQNMPLEDRPQDLDAKIIAALKKRQSFWEKDLANQNAKPPRPNTGVDPVLIENSLATNKFILEQVGTSSLTDEMKKQIIRDVLGTFTDNDDKMMYVSKEYENGKYVSKGKRYLKDILPEPFYSSATSTSSGGVVKNLKDSGADNCEYKPVVGRLPSAGKVQSIKRPGSKSSGQR